MYSRFEKLIDKDYQTLNILYKKSSNILLNYCRSFAVTEQTIDWFFCYSGVSDHKDKCATLLILVQNNAIICLWTEVHAS